MPRLIIFLIALLIPTQSFSAEWVQVFQKFIPDGSEDFFLPTYKQIKTESVRVYVPQDCHIDWWEWTAFSRPTSEDDRIPATYLGVDSSYMMYKFGAPDVLGGFGMSGVFHGFCWVSVEAQPWVPPPPPPPTIDPRSIEDCQAAANSLRSSNYTAEQIAVIAVPQRVCSVFLRFKSLADYRKFVETRTRENRSSEFETIAVGDKIVKVPIEVNLM